MKIAVLRETQPHERRVAATPETVKKFIGLGAEVAVEAGAGLAASIADADFAAAGAAVADRAGALAGAAIVLVLVALALIIYAWVIGMQFKHAMEQQADALGQLHVADPAIARQFMQYLSVHAGNSDHLLSITCERINFWRIIALRAG